MSKKFIASVGSCMSRVASSDEHLDVGCYFGLAPNLYVIGPDGTEGARPGTGGSKSGSKIA